jgi:hypothetical protein
MQFFLGHLLAAESQKESMGVDGELTLYAREATSCPLWAEETPTAGLALGAFPTA